MGMLSVKNATTWDTDELLAFAKQASVLAGDHAAADLETVEVKIFRINPKRKANLARYDSRVPTMSAKRSGSRLFLRVPSPLLYAPKTPLGKLAAAADARLRMPEDTRAALLVLMAQAIRRNYDDVIDDTHRGMVDPGWYTTTPPPITTKATGVRATKRRTLDEWEDRAREVYYARRAAERRRDRLEERIERLRKREYKLDAKVEKLKEREAKRKARTEGGQ